MYSYEMNNPNNIVIVNDYNIIPFGHRCTSAIACNYANIRKFSLPFDWCGLLFPKKFQNVLENNFEDFIPDISDVSNGIFHNKYKFSLRHFNPDISTGIEQYKRRIARFNNVINQPKKIYFIYINEDYLFNSFFSKEEYNNNIFNDMLELETFMKNKYVNIDYTILYFNFRHDIIPSSSNIINIVLRTTNLYDTRDANTNIHQELRIYCGKILSELFNTPLTLRYSHD